MTTRAAGTSTAVGRASEVWTSAAEVRAEATSRLSDVEPGWLKVCPVLADWQLTLLVLGEADISTADELRQQLTDAVSSWPYTTLIDVSGLTFCGLAGLDALRAAVRAGAAAGRDVRVTGRTRQLSWLESLMRHAYHDLASTRGDGDAPIRSHHGASPVVTRSGTVAIR